MTTQRIGGDSIYGTGTDGTVIIANNFTLVRDMYYDNLTINANVSLNTNGYRIFVKNILTLNGNIIGTNSNSGTISGSPALNSGNVSYSLGGNNGGNVYTATQLSNTYKKDILTLISGIVSDTSGQFISIKGGASGYNGANGVLTNATPGGTGPLNRDALAPGGPGTPGTGVPQAIGGTGGTGGGLVLICAKHITGVGSIITLGGGATSGAPSNTGSNGNAAPSATLTHHVDGSAHYITGNGVSGPHTSIVTPNLPHGSHVPATSAAIHGHTYRAVHAGTTHHSNDTRYHTSHHDHGQRTAGQHDHGHTYGTFSQGPHVDTLTGTFYAINGIPHTTPHRNHSGVAFSSDHSHTSPHFGHVDAADPHHGHYIPEHFGHKVYTPAGHVHYAYPYAHTDVNHQHQRHRQAGTVSHSGSQTYPGGTAGVRGSTTASQPGVTGGGGGIIIITDSTSNTISTSTLGGNGGTGTAQSGSVITIINA